MYDCAQLGPSPIDLKKHIADLLGLPMDRLRLAKYKPEIFQWVDISNQQVSVLLVMEQLYILQCNVIHVHSAWCGITLYGLCTNSFSWAFYQTTVCSRLLKTAAVASYGIAGPTVAIDCCSIFATITTYHSFMSHTHTVQYMQEWSMFIHLWDCGYPLVC